MASQFISNSTVTYSVSANGTTTVTHDITLQNASSDFYATSYTLSLNGISPINPKAYEGGSELPTSVSEKDGATSIKVDFPNAVVGKDAKREFSIVFSDKTLVTKAGEIWEITTPKLADTSSFDFFSTILKIPDSFGNLAYISPAPSFKTTSGKNSVYSFDKNASLNSPITAAFGNFQVFSFNLNYHLENPLNYSVSTDIALPPDTNFQKMNYTQMDPKPNKITVDADGNWLATYQLQAREKVDVKIDGSVQIFANPQTFPKADLNSVTKDLAATEFWQINDPKIQALAKKYTTPHAIYDYVAKTLSYDYARVAPNIERFGASKALQNTKNAICTEFTDLFIAIARAAGIPAREIEGFAYTENPKIQPLSLVADVLHAWPEYWDSDKQSWIPVDPTWGSTSGIDYFNKLDLRHFAFVVHGSDAKKPYPAGSYKQAINPEKDVNVSFGSLPANRASAITIESQTISQLPFSDQLIRTRVKNAGPTALYESNFSTSIGQGNKIAIIPPFGYVDETVDIKYSFLGQKIPNKVEILINGQKKSEFNTYKTYVAVSNLLMLSLFAFFLIFLVYLKFRDAKTKRNSD